MGAGWANDEADQLLFHNGDVVSGTFLGKSETIIYFESPFFGTLKVPSALAAVKLASEKVKQESPHPKPSKPTVKLDQIGSNNEPPKKEPRSRPSEHKPTEQTLPTSINVVGVPSHSTGFGLIWESAESTLNRFVHDRVPEWFPTLPEDWKGSLKLGVNINESVSTSTRYHGEISLEGDKPKTNYKFGSHFSFAETDSVRSEHDWGLSGRFRYKTDKRGFVETFASYDIDELYEPSSRMTTSVGYGIKPFKNSNFDVDAVLGGALEQLDYSEESSYTVVKLNFNQNLKWKFNKHLSLTQSLRFYITPDEDLYYNYRFESGLNTLIVGAFNLGVSYRLDYDSKIDSKDARQKSRIITSLGVKF